MKTITKEEAKALKGYVKFYFQQVRTINGDNVRLQYWNPYLKRFNVVEIPYAEILGCKSYSLKFKTDMFAYYAKRKYFPISRF